MVSRKHMWLTILLTLIVNSCGFTEQRYSTVTSCQELDILQNKNRMFIQADQEETDRLLLALKTKCESNKKQPYIIWL